MILIYLFEFTPNKSLNFSKLTIKQINANEIICLFIISVIERPDLINLVKFECFSGLISSRLDTA